MPLPPAWPQVDHLGTNAGSEAAGLHTIGPLRMQSYEFQPSFNDGIGIDLSTLLYSPTALMYQGAGHSGDIEGENPGGTPR